jgi:hypothetical protein
MVAQKMFEKQDRKRKKSRKAQTEVAERCEE